MKQQTAVQWLKHELNKEGSASVAFKHLFHEALAMELDQKILAHIAGQEHKTPFIYDYDAAEQYITDLYQNEQ